jgi:hypothetical protein
MQPKEHHPGALFYESSGFRLAGQEMLHFAKTFSWK